MTTFTVIDDTTDPVEIAAALLPAGSGFTIDPATVALVSGPSSAMFYDGSLEALGIGAGLLLTSGTMPALTNTVGYFGVSNGMAGDPALDAVVNTVFRTRSYDATTVSFELNVTDPTVTGISFNIVFGSDEFPEWVNQFVDIGVVLVNGVNVAYFNHDPRAPLSVIGSNLAASYFINNTGNLTTSSYGGTATGTSRLPIEYDGVSAVLTVFAPVHLGANSIKIGVADTGDHIYDSGLFISNLQATTLPISGIAVEVQGSEIEDSVQGTQAAEDIHGLGGADDIKAGGGDDVVQAGGGDDSLQGDAGYDVLDGGEGNDVARYAGRLADYTITAHADGSVSVTDMRPGSPDRTDMLLQVEYAAFSDAVLDLSTLEVTAAAPPGGDVPAADNAAPVVAGPVAFAVTEFQTPLPSAEGEVEVEVEIEVEIELETADDSFSGGVAIPNSVDLLAQASDADATDVLSVVGLPATLPDGIAHYHKDAAWLPTGYYGALVYHPAIDLLVIDPKHPAFDSLAKDEVATITIDYGISDGVAVTPAQAIFTITGTNDAPIVAGVVTAAGDEDGAPIVIDALALASDVDHDAVLSVTDAPAGEAEWETPNDGQGGHEDDTAAPGLPAEIAFSFVNPPAGVTFDAATNRFVLDPGNAAFQSLGEGETAEVHLTYGVTDGMATVRAEAVVTVTGVNDAPVIAGSATLTVADDAPGALHEAEALEQETHGAAPLPPNAIDLLAMASDVDANDVLSVTDVPAALPPGVSLLHVPAYVDASGYYGAPVQHPARDLLLIDPAHPDFQSLAEGETLEVGVDYGVTDGHVTVAARAVFTIVGTNDAPVIAGVATASATEDGGAAILSGLALASDVDHGAVLHVTGAPPPVPLGDSAQDLAETPPAPVTAGGPLDLAAGLPAGVTFDASTDSFVVDAGDAAFQSLSEGEARVVTIDYGVTDGLATSAATARITVVGTNDPTVVSGPQSFAAAEGAAVIVFDPLANASDVDARDVLSVVSTALPAGLRPIFLPSQAGWSGGLRMAFDPNAAAFQPLALGEVETVTWTYRITDGHGAVETSASFTVTGTNDAPVVVTPARARVVEDGAGATLDVLAGVVDPDHGAVLTVVGVPALLPEGISWDAAAHSFSIDPTAAVFQDLAQGEVHTYAVAFGITDGIATTVTQVAFDVVGTNDVPIVSGPATGTPNEDGNVVTVNATDTATDPDAHQGLRVVDVPDMLPSGVSYDPVDQRFSLDPTDAAYQHLGAGQEETVTIAYGLFDGFVTVPTSVVFTVSGRNDTPVVAGAVLVTTAEDGGQVTADLLARASDVDNGDIVTVKANQGGGIVLATSGAAWTAPVQYTVAGSALSLDAAQFNALRAGEAIELSFTYTVTDGNKGNGDAAAETRILVAGANDAPTALALGSAHVAENSGAGTAVGQFATTDADRGEAFTYTLLDNAGGVFAIAGDSLVVASGAVLDYEAQAAYGIVVRVTDSAGASLDRGFTIAVDNLLGASLGGSSKADVVGPGAALATTGEEDTVAASGGNDTVDGWIGNDSLDGGSGDDLLIGGAGSDVLMGGAGNDTVQGGAGNDRILVNSNEGLFDALQGGEGLDTFVALNNGGVSLSGFNALGASIEVWEGNGRGATGTSLAEVFDFSGIVAFTGAGLGFLDAGDGADRVTGSGFADDLRGGAGNDLLRAGAGADTIDGGAGNDTLWGGAGNDVLRGNSGVDSFALNAGDGVDTILDFIAGSGSGHDVVDLGAALFANFAAVQAGLKQVGADAVLTAGADGLVFKGVAVASLVAADFLFH